MAKPVENCNDNYTKKDGIWQDERFSHLVSDPRFKHLSKFEKKVNIDKRFKGMFNDDKFKVKYSVDKYGRKINKTSSEDLKKYYKIDTSDEEEEIIEKQNEEAAILIDRNVEHSFGNDNENNLDVEVKELPETLKQKLLNSSIDYARGEGRLLTDSSSDDEDVEDSDDELFIEHVWGELDNDADTTEESTRRLAVCNMDWDRVRSVDIMVLCNSFLPPGGMILSVKIYPSDYGKERLAHEELNGPEELTFKQNQSVKEISNYSDDDLVKDTHSDIEEGEDYHMERLRQYQLNRLKYYYAVIECDCVETADKIYKECDGIEYESTATKLDLRFIPNDTNFDNDEPRDICVELPDLHKYKPRIFKNTALQQAKVELTWDETSLERKELGEKLSSGKINEVSDADLRRLVAYSSDEEQNGEYQTSEEYDKSENVVIDDPVSKYKHLLQMIEKKEKEDKKNIEMEYTWNINTNTDEVDKKTETQIRKSSAELTPIERVLEKRIEKNRTRKEIRKQRKRIASLGDNDTNLENNNEESDDYPDNIDMNDPYFAEEFANGDFEAPKTKSKYKNKNILKKKKMNEEDCIQRNELELLMNESEDRNHFSLDQIQLSENKVKSKRKRKSKLKKSKHDKEDPVVDNFEIDIKDDRFKAVYNNHLFNIDPTDPHFKKTKGMEKIIQEKLKQRHNSNNDTYKYDRNSKAESKKEIENNVLIKLLKQKIENKFVN